LGTEGELLRRERGGRGEKQNQRSHTISPPAPTSKRSRTESAIRPW
jgi:hypothetical protein